MSLITMETNHGSIVIELNHKAAPVTCSNFLEYVNRGHYTNTLFHRVISGFMIQGGGFDLEWNQKSTLTSIDNEADNGLKNEIGTIAMARTNDPHSATCQFFINVKDNDFLNFTSRSVQGWGYCVFGKVIEGMDVVRKIEGVKTGVMGFHRDAPITPVIIQDVFVRKLNEEGDLKSTNFDPHEHYETVKRSNFVASSRLEGVEIDPDNALTLEEIKKKYTK